MTVYLTEDLISNLTAITQANISFVNKKCARLSQSQLNWTPSTGVWSIQEILSHLNAYSNYYHRAFEEKIAQTKFTQAKETFASSPLGKSAWKSMKLGRANNVKRKFKAPKNYNPTLNTVLIEDDAVNTFLKDQNDLIELLKKAKTVNLRKVKVKISISKFVRLRLGDALMFVIYHNERHVQQIKNLITHRNFPKKK
jgi:hypothetical protein